MSNDPTKPFEQIGELNKRLSEYTVRVNKVIAGGVAPAIKAQADSAVAALESAVAHGEKLTQVKLPQEAVEEQTALAQDLGENFQSTARKLLEIQQDTGAELKAVLEEGVKTFTPEALSQLFKKGS
ncbi:MAG: phasin family protein [Gammaproteobacteria bacterium]|nr:phasin family protein [Gammaproteobacteria bacterium]